MATIITVHGTGATGPEEGQAWWQRGSEFEKHLCELVEGEDGVLYFQRLIWDGANSEISRRGAARKLYESAEQLESKGEKYCVVGHSHGGSVVAAALLLAASKGKQLPGLKRWITVGTPFIQSIKAFWLFSRSGPLGQAALVSLAAYGFLSLLGILASGVESIELSFWVLMIVVPFLGLYGSLWVLNRRKLYMYRPSTLQFAAKTYTSRLVSLHHKNDEAINGLKSLKNLDVRIFQRGFAVPIFSFVSLFLLPILIVALAMSPSLLNELAVYNEMIPRSEFGGSFFNNLATVGGLLISFLVKAVKVFMAAPGLGPASFFISLFVLVLPICLITISLAITYSVGVGSHSVSNVLSLILNRLTWQQIRKVGFGNDTLGEVSINADSTCLWSASAWLALPDQIAKEVTELGNMAASVAVIKFRDLVTQLAFSKDKEAKEFLFSEYLTWDELIHCSYFNVPRFRMLVAYAIAQCPGFYPSAAFKNHPDYELVAHWYEEIQPTRATVVVD